MAESSDSAGYSHLNAPDTSTARKMLYVPGSPSGEEISSEQECVQSSSGTHLTAAMHCCNALQYAHSRSHVYLKWKGAQMPADALRKVLAGCRALCPWDNATCLLRGSMGRSANRSPGAEETFLLQASQWPESTNLRLCMRVCHVCLLVSATVSCCSAQG